MFKSLFFFKIILLSNLRAKNLCNAGFYLGVALTISLILSIAHLRTFIGVFDSLEKVATILSLKALYGAGPETHWLVNSTIYLSVSGSGGNALT